MLALDPYETLTASKRFATLISPVRSNLIADVTYRDIKVVFFCCDGLYQRDLMHRLHDAFNLQAVVLQERPATKFSLARRIWNYRDPQRLFRYVLARANRRKYMQRAQPIIETLFYRNGCPPLIPDGASIVRVDNINAPATLETLDRCCPDVVAVNGTRLIRQPLLDRISNLPLGMINLHTGLSPYSRGGNCNLFMLLERHPELVGITIHHIAAGIDNGDIIITSRPDTKPDDNYEIIDAKTFRLGNDCLITAIRQLFEGRAERVPQWTEGKLFLRRTGYVYEPYLHVKANRLLEGGLVCDYLRHKAEMDASVRLVGSLS